MKSALSSKVAAEEMLVVDGLALEAIKTKSIVSMLNALEADCKVLLVLAENDEKVIKSARNIPGVVTTTAKILSVYDIVKAKSLVLDKAALAIIEEVFA